MISPYAPLRGASIFPTEDLAFPRPAGAGGRGPAGPRRVYCLDARTATAHFPGIGRYVAGLAGAMGPLLAPDEGLLILRDPSAASLFPLPLGEAPGVEVLDLAVSPFALRQQWQVPRLLRARGVRVYHSPYTLLPYAAGVPTLLTVHDLIPLLFPAQSSRKARLLFGLALRLALGAAQAVITVSDRTRQDLCARYQVRGRVAVIPEAAGPQFAPAAPEAVARVRRELGLPERYALYLGSDKPHKNLDLLLRAWSEPLPWPLVVAGVRTGHLPSGGQSREQVIYLGQVAEEQLPPLYSGARLFVFPSLYEGFGLPVLEAMACGTPVLCADRASLPEVGGAAAVYCDPTDPASLRGLVRSLAAAPERLAAMSEAGLRRAATFTWQRSAALTLDLYRQLARPGVSGSEETPPCPAR